MVACVRVHMRACTRMHTPVEYKDHPGWRGLDGSGVPGVGCEAARVGL